MNVIDDTCNEGRHIKSDRAWIQVELNSPRLASQALRRVGRINQPKPNGSICDPFQGGRNVIGITRRSHPRIFQRHKNEH